MHRLYHTIGADCIGSRRLHRPDCFFRQRSAKPTACIITKTQADKPKAVPGRRVASKRGRNDLPPGKKEGETMTPDRHYEHEQNAFDLL